MLINQTTALLGSKVVLVPYRRHHVPRYHEWMSDPVVREATASEPLSLEEEYEMQEMTFIILSQANPPLKAATGPSALHEHDVPDSMIGDINVFLSTAYPSDDNDGDDEGEHSSPSAAAPRRRCEVEIMIPLPSSQRRGFAFEALRIFLPYVSRVLNVPPRDFFARIGSANAPSLELFQKRLGFKRGKTSVFDEIEMTYDQDEWTWPEPETVEVEYAISFQRRGSEGATDLLQ